MQRILIVEDEKKLLEQLQTGLSREGYEVATTVSGEEGYYQATTSEFDAVLLDVMLPGRSGFEILSDLRARGFDGPVLVVTALDAIDDRVRGLDSGADDYLVKPFAFAELVARLQALLRRNLAQRVRMRRVGDLELDLVSRRVVRNGAEVDLTTREFELLDFFLQHADEAVTRDMIARDVWNEPDGVLTNVIDVHVSHLRKKIDLPGLHPLIRTIRGVGYCLRNAG